MNKQVIRSEIKWEREGWHKYNTKTHEQTEVLQYTRKSERKWTKKRIKNAYLKVTSGHLSIKFSMAELEKGQWQGGGVIMDTSQVKKRGGKSTA